MATVTQPEALVSALIKFVVPDQINAQIDQIESDIDYYQEMIDDPYVGISLTMNNAFLS
jgi:hypothetical protein